MKHWKKITAGLLALTVLLVGGGFYLKSNQATYLNPLLEEAADPDVVYHKGTYYLYPTTPARNVGGIKVFTSTDLVNWTDHGLAMTAGDKNWGTHGFWAPDLIEKDGKFYMYYTAEEHLSVSVSDSPLGPFEQVAFGPLHEDIQEIDAHAFIDDDGQAYLYFVRFTGGNVIWGAKLNDDMLSIDESSIVEVLAPSQEWEQDIASVNEGPYMLKKDGIYYLTYSGSHFESPMYGAGYATATSPLGPFKKYAKNPIMQSNEEAHGTGHHAVADSPDGKEMFMVYHRHQTLWNTDPREFCIDRLRYGKNTAGETILEVVGPTVTEQAVPSGAKDVENFIAFEPTELATVKDQPESITIITSKSTREDRKQAQITWREKKDGLVGQVTLPKEVKNLGELPLEIPIENK